MSEMLDLGEQTLDVIVTAEPPVGGRCHMFGQVCETDPVLNHTMVLRRLEQDRSNSCLEEERPELVSWSGVVSTSFRRSRSCGSAAEDGIKIVREVIGENVGRTISSCAIHESSSQSKKAAPNRGRPSESTGGDDLPQDPPFIENENGPEGHSPGACGREG